MHVDRYVHQKLKIHVCMHVGSTVSCRLRSKINVHMFRVSYSC